MPVKMEGKEVPSNVDFQGREFEEKPKEENLDSLAEAVDESWKNAENGHPLLVGDVFGPQKEDMHDGVPNSVPYDDEPVIKLAVEPLKLNVQQVDASRFDLGKSSSNYLFRLDADDGGDDSGTEEEQSEFLKELEKFFRERSAEFKPPKLRGKGVNTLKLWRAVMRRGGYDKVTSGKLWGQVAKSCGPPKTFRAVSRTFRSFYEKALLDFEREKFRAGELNIPSSSNMETMGNETPVDTITTTICDGITLREMMKEASASGRTPRNAAARARLRWHSKCSLGNGEVSIPVVKEKRTAQKGENSPENNAGSIKRKSHSAEEDVVETVHPEVSESRVNAVVVDVGLPSDEGKDDEQKMESSPGFASTAQLKDAAEKALVVLQTQEQALTSDTLKMLAPHLKVLMSSSSPIEVVLACKRFEMVMADQLSTFVEAKRRKIELEGEIVSTWETLASTSPRESAARSSSARKRLAGLEDRKLGLEREIARLDSECAQVEVEIEEAKEELRVINDLASKERDRSATRDKLIKELALAEMSTCQGDAALSLLKATLRDSGNRFGAPAAAAPTSSEVGVQSPTMSNENENDQDRTEGPSALNINERALEEQLEAKENSVSPAEAMGEPPNPFENRHPIAATDVSAAVEESGYPPVDSPQPSSANVDVSENPQGLLEPNFGRVEVAAPPDLKDEDPTNEKLDLLEDHRNLLERMGGSIEAAAPLEIEDKASVDKTVDISHNLADFVEPIQENIEGSVGTAAGSVEGSAELVHQSVETSVAHMHESNSVEPPREIIEATVYVDRKDEATADQNGGTIEMPLKEGEIAVGNLAVNHLQTSEPVYLDKVDDFVINESKFSNAEDNQPTVQEEDAFYMISYDDEPENNMVGSMNIDAEQVAASPAENGSSSMKHLFLINENDEGSVSGTEEDQSLFMKELENFFKERKMEFRPPKFYGEGLNCLKLWRAVIGLGGYDRVTSCKLWRQVGESFRPPKTCTTVSWTFRGFYEKALLDFEREKTLSGELNIQAPLPAEPMCIDNQASGSGRMPRESAARARQGWHSQRLLGNGEVSDPIIKLQEKGAFSAQKREKQLKSVGPLKRKKQPLEEDAVTTTLPKAAKTQVDVAVVDIGLPADWVKINVQKTMDCFEVYALVPGLLREEVRVQSDPAGRLVISGDPEQPDNPWGVTPFKKVINLPSRIDPHQTSAVVTLHGQLFVRVPFELAEQ
ncbi:hypothetical protein MLD38_004768 [Melastoma candidum]|uniref:Uncharacterized protein n=1 Tax=Melastoma candidum TaxID=119954 RepID=A0ACB9S770_9MYRT|nr:hypothetical protein MLD38_004768 [Melastoma candidum]